MIYNQSVELDEKEELKDVMNNIYAQQHFDTTAREFTNDVFNESIQQFLNQIPSLRESLLQVPTAGSAGKKDEEIAAEIDSKLGKLTIDFYAHLEKNADALEMYLYEHILTVPPEKILQQDNARLHYEELINNLKLENSLHSSKGNENDESSLVETMTKTLDEERCELLRKKCQKMRLKLEIELADRTLRRLDSLEYSVNSVTSNFDGSLKDFVLKHIAAVKTLPKLGDR